MRALLLVGLVVVLVAGATGPAAGKPKAKPTTPGKPKCSAAGMNVKAQIPLKAPPKVRAMHQQILRAAADCDYERLQKLGRAGRPRFDFSFNGDKSPAAYWRKVEARGDKFMARMIQVLKLDYGVEGKTYVWPAAFARNASEEDYEDLIPIFGENQVRLFRDYGGYDGVRVGIVEDGDWIYAVDGD